MALSAEDFREAERKKMRLQASIAARRNSLITMVPRSIPQSAGVVPRPDDLPGKFDKATADANNAAALKYLENAGNQFGPQSLNTLEATGQIMDPFNQLNLYPQVANSPFTKALGVRAANLTADDMHRTGMVDPKEHAAAGPSVLNDEAPGYAQVEDLGGLSAPRPQPPSVTAPPPSVVDGINVAPGAKNAGVPGNRSRIAELLGLSDATRQRNFNAQAFDERTHGEGQRFPGQAMQYNPAGSSVPQKGIKSATDHLVDQIKTAKKRANIIRAAAGVFGGNRKAADRYEARRLAEINEYAGRYALSNLDDSDFQSNQKLFQALYKNGMPLDQIVKVIDSGVADKAGAPELKQIREEDDYVTYQVYPDGSMKEFSRSPIASGKADTNVNITMPGSGKAGDAFAKGLGEKVFAVLGGGEDDLFEKLRKDNIQIGPLIDAVESGMVQTGKGQEFFKNFKGVLGQFLPDSKTKDLFNKEAGMEEWWKSTVDSFVGLKLAMTKGAISDAEMKLFMDMIPSLSKTEEGNLRLLRLMRSLNNIVLAKESGTLDYIKNLAERGEDIGSESPAQQTVDWYKFIDIRKQVAIKDFHRVANGYPDSRDEAFLSLRADKALKQQTDAQINEHLDKYYPKVSADG